MRRRRRWWKKKAQNQVEYNMIEKRNRNQFQNGKKDDTD